MLNNMFKVGFVIFSVLFLSCSQEGNGAHSSQKNDYIEDTSIHKSDSIENNLTEIKAMHLINCDSLIRQLVYTSEYKCALCDTFICSVNGETENFFDDPVTTIQVFCPKTNHGLPIGSIDLNLLTNELSDVTFDEEDPIKINYVQEVYDLIIQNCKDK